MWKQIPKSLILSGIDFVFIGNKGKEFEKYIGAIQEAVGSNYAPMVQIVLRALRLALASSGSVA